MSSAKRAVFLSYASEDAPPAQRICTALRTVGIEVWFDQSELRGGDAWDAMIRGQIKACALFWLERARVQKDGGYSYIKVDPLLRSLKGDPHYVAMLAVAKLH